jgi:hypothetical protein
MYNSILILLLGNIFSENCNNGKKLLNIRNKVKKLLNIRKAPLNKVKKIDKIVNNNSIIKVKSGTNATLTYFKDTVFQCISGIPKYNSMAVNPLLLGFTLKDWNNKYANANQNLIPWCGKKMEIIVNNKKFIGTIIDTCDPGNNGAFIDPNTGQIIGGKCDYTNVIDLYSDKGLEFLKTAVGDDFYQGKLTWRILDDKI